MKVDDKEGSVVDVAARMSSREAEDCDQRRAVAITGAKTALVRREAYVAAIFVVSGETTL